MEKKAPNDIATWREKLGLTQDALAEYLQVSSYLLNLVEHNEGELPKQALADLQQLIDAYEAIDPADEVESPEERQQALVMLEGIIAETSPQLEQVKKQLKAYQETVLLVQSFQVARLTDQSKDAKTLRQSISQLEAEALKKLQTFPRFARTKLRLERVRLQTILQEAQRMLAELLAEQEGGKDSHE